MQKLDNQTILLNNISLKELLPKNILVYVLFLVLYDAISVSLLNPSFIAALA